MIPMPLCLIGSQLAVTRLSSSGLCISGQIGEGHLLGRKEGGNKQTALGVYCETDVGVLELAELIVNQICVACCWSPRQVS